MNQAKPCIRCGKTHTLCSQLCRECEEIISSQKALIEYSPDQEVIASDSFGERIFLFFRPIFPVLKFKLLLKRMLSHFVTNRHKVLLTHASRPDFPIPRKPHLLLSLTLLSKGASVFLFYNHTMYTIRHYSP